MYSIKLIDVHFWTSTIGVVLYVVPMWVAGVTQGLMWRAVNDDGTLTYSFIESLKSTYPYYGFACSAASCSSRACSSWPTTSGRRSRARSRSRRRHGAGVKERAHASRND